MGRIRTSYPSVELHLIGPLQTNKVKEALELFDVIQTLDRPKLAEAIAAYREKAPTRTRAFFIQVNTGKESQKAGVIPEEADTFIDDCIHRLQLPVIGLMCVPPEDQPATPHFALLRDIALRHGLKELSMGMSGDFESAARMGSTIVRIGTALFGERKKEAV
jgi:pyridoxal phosphate enzyme (YggS family)